jgi:hypothetical protein
MTPQWALHGRGNGFERTIVEGRAQTASRADDAGTVLEGGVEFSDDFWGDVIDGADPSDDSSKGGEFAGQPLGVGVQHAPAEDLSPDSQQFRTAGVDV